MIYSYVGRCGSGKTLLMVYHTLLDQSAGIPIFSNIKLSVPFTELNKKFFEYYPSMNLKQCTVLGDELSLYFPARKSMSSKNIKFMPFILQTRKKEVTLRYTAQQMRLLDVIIRENTDGEYRVYMWVKRNNKIYKKPEDWNHKPGDDYTIVADYYDKNNQYGEMMFKRKIYIEHVQNIFPMYDTFQVIDINKGD